MNVAWIGLGHMGLPTARTVAAAGHPVKAYDIVAPAPQDAAGLTVVGSARTAVADADVVCLAVFSDEQVHDVLAGPDGIFGSLRDGTVIAIFTTGTLEALAELVAAAPPGVAVLDTCFSRQRGATDSGRLNLLVGGDSDALERCRPVLDTFAHAIHHAGGSGAGRSLKLVNNLMWAAHLRVAGDALRLAEGLGLDPAATAAIVHGCSGSSDVLQAVFAKEDAGELLEFIEPYAVKDASAAVEAARGAGVELGVLGAVVRAYADAGRVWEEDRPLRVAPVAELTDEQRELLAPTPGFERYIGRRPGPNDPPGEIYLIMMHNPELLRHFRHMASFFMTDGALPPRDRELALLRLAWLRQVPFIWGEHVFIGKMVGLTAGEIERVTAGSGAAGWSDGDRAILRAIEELLDTAMISDATWDELAARLDDRQLVELPVLVGQYQALGYFQNCMRVHLWEGNAGMATR